MQLSRVFLVTALALLSSRASADIAPPVGYVEACTVERQRQSGEECVSCSTYFGEADACMKKHAPRGFAQRCRTRGASTWSEVWCKASSGAGVSSMGETKDASAVPPDAGQATPAAGGAPGTTPSGTGATPVSTSSAEPDVAPSPSGTPAPSTSSAPSTPGKVPEKKSGSCGACAVGAAGSDAGPLALLLGAALAALTRRRLRLSPRV